MHSLEDTVIKNLPLLFLTFQFNNIIINLNCAIMVAIFQSFSFFQHFSFILLVQNITYTWCQKHIIFTILKFMSFEAYLVLKFHFNITLSDVFLSLGLSVFVSFYLYILLYVCLFLSLSVFTSANLLVRLS